METLPLSLQSCLRRSLGIEDLYPLQKRSLGFLSSPEELDGEPVTALMGLSGDAVINAPTGYGKTLAYILPVIKYFFEQSPALWQKNSIGLRAIILVPNHELVDQVLNTAQLLCKSAKNEVNIRVAGLQGGTNWLNEIKSIFVNDSISNILVSTPARILEHLNNGGLKTYLGHLRYLIVDEADLIIENNCDDFKQIVEILNAAKNEKTIRKVLCSATIAEGTVLLAHVPLRCPRFFSFDDAQNGDQKVNLPKNLDCFLWRVRGNDSFVYQYFEEDLVNIASNNQKDRYVWHLLRDFLPKWQEDGRLRKTKLQRLNKLPKCIIFVNSKDTAIHLSSRLNKQYEAFREYMELGNSSRTLKHYPSGISQPLHPLLSSRDRKSVLASFLQNQQPLLISTDISGRGIDDLEVEMVISYDPPASISNLIHRSGRTARANDFGSAIHLCSRRDISRIMAGIEKNSSNLGDQILDYEDVLIPENDKLEEEEEEEE